MVLEGDAPEPALDRADVILQVRGKVERLGATSWSVVEWRRRGGEEEEVLLTAYNK